MIMSIDYFTKKLPRTYIIAVFLLFVPVFTFSVSASTVLDDDKEENDVMIDIEEAKEGTSIVKPLDIPVVEGAPVIDGDINDEFWRRAIKLTIDYELFPTRLAKPSVDTDVYVAFGQGKIYLAFFAHDPDIREIRSSLVPDDAVKNTDYVALTVDTIGNNTRTYEFRVNPHGSTTDLIKGSVSDTYHYDWDAHWESAGTIVDGGYVVEMAIPFSEMDIVEPEEGRSWFLMLSRNYPRSVRHTFASIYALTTTEIPKTKQSNLMITPYVLYQFSEERDLKSDSPVWAQNQQPLEVGMDAKWFLDSSTKLSITVNPDFSDVEVDIAKKSINNPFNILLPEKRVFFTEGIDILMTHQPFVYTRNITDPKFGIKFNRRKARESSSFFYTFDKETSLIIPGNLSSKRVDLDLNSHSGALRYRFDRESGNSFGLLSTYRIGEEDYRNLFFGFDGFLNLSLDDKIRYQLALSNTKYPESLRQELCDGDDCSEPPPEACIIGECGYNESTLRVLKDGDFSDYAMRITYERKSPGWIFTFDYVDVGEDFRGDLGYFTMVDYRLLSARVGYNWFFKTLEEDDGNSRVRFYGVVARQEAHDGAKIADIYDIWFEYRGSFQTVFRPGYRIRERVANRYNSGSLEIEGNAPLFDEKYFQWYFETSPLSWLRIGLDGRWGDQIDQKNIRMGKIREFIPQLGLALGKGFLLNLSHTSRWLNVEDDRLFKEDYTTFDFSYKPDQKKSFYLIFVNDVTKSNPDLYLYESVRREEVERTYQFVFKYNLSQKTFFTSGIKLVIEDNDDIASENFAGREIFLKFQYAF